MAKHEENKENPSAGAEASVSKKNYQKPRVLYREPLEAMAALCTPAPPAKASPGTCPSGPVNS